MLITGKPVRLENRKKSQRLKFCRQHNAKNGFLIATTVFAKEGGPKKSNLTINQAACPKTFYHLNFVHFHGRMVEKLL